VAALNLLPSIATNGFGEQARRIRFGWNIDSLHAGLDGRQFRRRAALLF
jgi:hypothetical protein